MWLPLIPYALAVLFTASFLLVILRYPYARRHIPRRAVRAICILTAVLTAQTLMAMLWRSAPIWSATSLSPIAFGAGVYAGWPVVAQHPETLFSPATIARWRALRARLRR